MRYFFLCLSIACLACVGCTTLPRVTYKPNESLNVSQPKKIRIAVLTFKDHGQAPTLPGALFTTMAVVPLIFYTTVTSYDGHPWFNQSSGAGLAAGVQPIYPWSGGGGAGQALEADPKDYADCLAEDLAESGAFQSVKYVSWEELEKTRNDYDLIITGDFLYDRNKLVVSNYGLGIVGTAVFLEFLPILPTSFLLRDLAIDLYAFRPDKPFEKIWEHKIRQKGETRVGFHVGGAASLNRKVREDTPAVLKAAYRPVGEDLLGQLASGGQLRKALGLNRKED